MPFDEGSQPLVFTASEPNNLLISGSDCEYVSDFLRTLAFSTDSSILSKLQYCDEVILSDFQPEFFVENPIMFQVLSALIIASKSSRVQIFAANILVNLCQSIKARLKDIVEFPLQSHYSGDGAQVLSYQYALSRTAKSILEEPKIAAALNNSLLPLSVAKLPPGASLSSFAVAMACTSLAGLTSDRLNVQCALLRLLNSAVDLFLICTQPGSSRQSVSLNFLMSAETPSESAMPSTNVTSGLGNMLELWGVMLCSFAKGWNGELGAKESGDFESSRLVYIGLFRALFRLLSALWTPEACACLLPAVSSFELALGLLDCLTVSTAMEAVGEAVGLPALVRFLDPEISFLYERMQLLRKSLASAVAFMRGFQRLQRVESSDMKALLTSAMEGMNAVEFLSSAYIREFVLFLAEVPLIAEESVCNCVLSQSRPHLLRLLAHSSSDIRLATYSRMLGVLSSSISIDSAADPTLPHHKRIAFILNSEVLGELVEFGLRDRIPGVSSAAQSCLRILLDSHKLVPDSTWVELTNLLLQPPQDECEIGNVTSSTEWQPLKPLLPFGAASITTPTDERLEERVLCACLGVGGFTEPHSSSPLSCLLPLLYHPLPTVRLKASSAPQVRSLLSKFELFEAAEILTSVEETLCDLLVMSPEEVKPVDDCVYEKEICHTIDTPSEEGEVVKSLAEMLGVVAEEGASVEVRCTAGERVLALLRSMPDVASWRVLNGPGILLGWLSTLLGAPSQSLTTKLRCEPVVRVQLAIAHYLIVRDPATRSHLYINRESCLPALLHVGLLFWKELRIRRLVSLLLALVLFTPAIRYSDESPVCLPQVVVCSFCLPFTCPVYSLESRHRIDRPDFSSLLQFLAKASPSLTTFASQRNRALTISVIRALRTIWRSCLTSEEQELLVANPLLKCTSKELKLIESGDPSVVLPRLLSCLQASKSHAEATDNLNRLQLLAVVFWRTPEALALWRQWWLEARLSRFLHVLPSCTGDYRLLIQCLRTLASLDFSPSWDRQSILETSRWLVEELMSGDSPLAFALRCYDSSVGNTDSQRLVEAKCSLHFNVLPHFFEVLLAAEDHVSDFKEVTLKIGRSGDKENQPSSGYGSAVLNFLFEWAIKFVERHLVALKEYIGPLHTTVKILQRIILRPIWRVSVPSPQEVFTRLFSDAAHLVDKILDFQQTNRLHAGILNSTLLLLHCTSVSSSVVESENHTALLEASSLLPQLSVLADPAYPSETRRLAITVLANSLSTNKIEELPCDIWGVALSMLLSPKETQKIKAASAHLLANLTVRLSELLASPSTRKHPLMPTFLDPQTQELLTGTQALVCILDSANFLPILSEMLSNLKLPLTNQKFANAHPKPILFSTPLLVSRVCSLLSNLCLVLPPEFIIQQFNQHNISLTLMNTINPKLLKQLISSCQKEVENRRTAYHLASSFSQIIRLFRCLLCVGGPDQKVVFLSDRRFITLLVENLSGLSVGSMNLEGLWKETLQFLGDLLESEQPATEDLVLRHALQPLAAQAQQWGTLIHRLIQRAIELNSTSPSGDACRRSLLLGTFDVLEAALIFVSVVLSYRVCHGSSGSNPVSESLDASKAEEIAAALISLENSSFRQPRIDVDGLLLDREVGAAGDCKTTFVFGQLPTHGRAIHSSLKILFCTSAKAKEKALEGGFLNVLFTRCRSLVDQLNLTMRVQEQSGSISADDFDKRSPPCGRQSAWSCLIPHLLRHLELLGNLFYRCSKVKQAALRSGFLKLASSIWPLGLIDTRVMHNLLFCLINLFADFKLTPSSTNGRSSPGVLAAGGSLMRSLERLLDSLLPTHNRGGGSGLCVPRSRSGGDQRTNRPCRPGTSLRDLILQQIFELLSNLAWSSEAVGFLAKTKALSHFTALDAKTLARVPRDQHLPQLWLRFIANLTFTREGQLLLLNSQGVVAMLVEHARFWPEGEPRFLVFLSLQNLCGCTNFKTHLYKEGSGALEVFASALEPSTNPPEVLLQVLTALSNAAYNCTKTRVLLKKEGFVQRLANLESYFRTGGMDNRLGLLPLVQLLLAALTG